MSNRLLTLAACLTWPMAAQSVVPEPTLDGVVVRDVSTPYSFDFLSYDPNGIFPPTVTEDAYNGVVRTQVIRDTDGTYDFYFRITAGPQSLGLNTFIYQWPTPFAVSVALHGYELIDNVGPVAIGFDPPLGTTATTNAVSANWHIGFGENVLREAVIVVDTDARAYSLSGGYQLQGYSYKAGGSSSILQTFAPVVPEPETWALMALGLGALALARRRVTAGAPRR